MHRASVVEQRDVGPFFYPSGWPTPAARVRARVRAAMGDSAREAGTGGGWAGGGRGGGGTASPSSSAIPAPCSAGNGEHKSLASPTRGLPSKRDISSSFRGAPSGGLPSRKHARTRGHKSDTSPVTPLRTNDRAQLRRTSVSRTACLQQIYPAGALQYARILAGSRLELKSVRCPFEGCKDMGIERLQEPGDTSRN